MRLAGASFTGRAEQPDDGMFKEVLHRATALLKGEGLPPEEADERRERLLAGFRWILVDEYQDIGPEQYELISALAGRTLGEDAGKLTLFAVGDDDQNIYAFNGASVEFIRRFTDDYGPRPEFLTENYRSTAHIVAASNAVIEPARDRMKVDHPIRINRARDKEPPGGKWEVLDPVSRGRVQILSPGKDPLHQARAVMAELERLRGLDDANWNWAKCAVIAREWEYLVPVRAYCEASGIRAQMANEDIPGFWRLRQTREFVDWLRGSESGIVDDAALRGWLAERPQDLWRDLLCQAVDEHALESGGGETPAGHFVEWLAEWGRDIRRRQQGLLLLSAHRAKGLEFDHVALLDGGWDRVGKDEDPDAARRLYYVAMTRARKTLTLARLDGSGGFQNGIANHPFTVLRESTELAPGSEAIECRHVRAALKEVDIGFAGRRHANDSIHNAIGRLSAGDRLDVRVRNDGRWMLFDSSGRIVGRLAEAFEPPRGQRFRSAEVFAVIGRRRDEMKPEFQRAIKCESWEVVVPELVFQPDHGAERRDS